MPRVRIIARRLAPVLLAGAVFVFPSGTAAAAPCADAGLVPTSANLTQVRAATLCLINQERTSRGLTPVTSNAQLLKASARYSRQMVAERFFAHVSPSGSTLVSRVRNGTRYLRGADSWKLGENLAWGSGALATPAATVNSWMASPGHRRNLLAPGFRHVGVGVTTGAPLATPGLPAATYTTDYGRRS